MVRESLRLSLDVTIPHVQPDIISAYISCLSSSQMRPEAFGRERLRRAAEHRHLPRIPYKPGHHGRVDDA